MVFRINIVHLHLTKFSFIALLSTAINTRTGMGTTFLSVRGRCMPEFVKYIYTAHICEQTKRAALP